MVLAVVPAAIYVYARPFDTRWPTGKPAALVPLAAGGLLGAVGFLLIARCVFYFAKIGKGTLASWDPTQRLVVEGPYRHVRNPMISGVWLILLGQALVTGSAWMLGWAVVAC